MPKIQWHHHAHGGWYYIDNDGNYWYKPVGGTITITTPDGREVRGWNEQSAWNALREAA